MSIPVANFFLPADFSDFSVPVDRSHAQCNGVLEAWKMKPVLGHPSFLHIPHTSVYTRYIFLLTFWGLSLHTTIHPIIHRLINESINQSIMNLSITSHKPLVLSHLGSGSCATRRTQRLTQWFHAMKIKYVCDEYNTNIYIYMYICTCSCTRTCICMHTYVSYPTSTGTSTCENGAYLGITWASWTLKSYSVDREFYHRSTTRKRDFHQGFGLRSRCLLECQSWIRNSGWWISDIRGVESQKTPDLHHDMENSPDNPRVNESGYGMRFEAVNKIVG